MKKRKRANLFRIFSVSLVIIAIIALLIFLGKDFPGSIAADSPAEEDFPMAINKMLTNELSNLPQTRNLDLQIEKFMRDWEIKGASIAIMKNEKLIYSKGYGWADEEAGIRTDVCHIFRIASLSKLITATTIMKMVEDSLLELSSRPFDTGGILDLPQFRNIKDKRVRNITIEDLLRHRGGFTLRGGDPLFNTLLIKSRMHLNTVPTNDDVIAYALSQNLGFTPGSGTRYSNLGYMILSEVIEELGKTDYEDYVQKNILNPAGIYDMHLAKNLYSERYPNEVRYYEPANVELVESFDGSGVFRPRCYGGNNIEGLLGAGAWVSSPSELLLFVASIDGKDGIPDIISRKSIAIMTSSSTGVLPIGWSKINSNGDWFRSGNLSGSSALIKYQTDRISWVFITNTSSWKGARFPRLIDGMFKKILQKASSFPDRDLFEPIKTQRLSQ